jgi:hypothetical protein
MLQTPNNALPKKKIPKEGAHPKSTKDGSKCPSVHLCIILVHLSLILLCRGGYALGARPKYAKNMRNLKNGVSHISSSCTFVTKYNDIFD